VLVVVPIVIRHALDSQYDEVASLNVEAFREYAQALAPGDWVIMQANLLKVPEMAKRGKLMVAQQDELVVGAIVYCAPGTSDERIFQREWASLRLLAVLPQHRGQGIGRQLTLACIQQSKQDKAAVIALHTSELMVAARRMYEQLGFQQDMELPRHFGIQYWRYVLKLEGSVFANRSP
jgi:ribosomal protein S18 acetylase RimI-like enzyme